MRHPPPRLSLPRRSLRTHLVVWNGVVLAVLLGLLGLTLRYAVAARVMASVDHELNARSLPLLHDLPPELAGRAMARGGPGGHSPGGPPPDGPPPPGGPPPGTSGFAGLPADRPSARAGGPALDPYFPRLFDLDGRRVGQHGTAGVWDRRAFAASRRDRTLFVTVVLRGVRMRILSRPTPMTGPMQGVVQVAYPLTDVDNAIRGVGQVLLALIPAALVCSGIAGAYLTDRVLWRVRMLTQTAARISALDPAERLPMIGEDEFSELAGTFNALLGRLEVAIRHQQDQVARQRRFTADASHELKTPLTVIQGSASLALSGPATVEEHAESLREIHQAAGTMARLVQDLLLLARADDDQLGRDRMTFPVREILARAVASVPHDGVPISLSSAEDALCLSGNEDELRRLFSNLLDNARRYTPPGGQITITTARAKGRALVTVADTGIGIAPEHLPHLGERFYRVDGARTRRDGGTGLGLSICRSIVTAHEGEMTITSAPGRGTNVIVSLPAATCI